MCLHSKLQDPNCPSFQICILHTTCDPGNHAEYADVEMAADCKGRHPHILLSILQTFSQYLATLGGAASKQTSLQSTMNSQNIAGLYKQQQTDDKFKVGSPSGSVYWTTGDTPYDQEYTPESPFCGSHAAFGDATNTTIKLQGHALILMMCQAQDVACSATQRGNVRCHIAADFSSICTLFRRIDCRALSPGEIVNLMGVPCAGYEPVPAPLQAQTASFANAVAPSVNQLTQAMLQLIPSPPPPPPPPTVIQALAPLEEVGDKHDGLRVFHHL